LGFLYIIGNATDDRILNKARIEHDVLIVYGPRENSALLEKTITGEVYQINKTAIN
jgi:hypothetical protein